MWPRGGREDKGGQSAHTGHLSSDTSHQTHTPSCTETDDKTRQVYLRQRRRPAKQKETQR